jgi:hypothetical protein
MFNLRSLDLNLLTVFEAISELRPPVNAADRLGLSQWAISWVERPSAKLSSNSSRVRLVKCTASISIVHKGT